MSRVKYDPAERIEAVRLAREVGQCEAARVLDIPRPTVQEWQRDARAAVVAMIDDDESLPWDERIELSAYAYLRSAREARRLADQFLADGKPREAREAMTTSAIATDKAQLLTGRATSRRESRSLRVDVSGERLAQMLGELPTRTPAAIEAKSSEGESKGFVIPTESSSDLPKRRRSTGGRPRKGPKNVSDTPVVPEGE